MYAIVEFSDSKDVAILPLNWIADATNKQDVASGKKKLVKFYWPTYARSTTKMAKALRNCVSADVQWPVFNTRVLGTAGRHIALILFMIFIT